MTVAELAREMRPPVLLLNSDREGEICAAVRQICKRLRRHGLDVHDLADALEGRSRPPSGAATSWAEAVDWILKHGAEMTARDRAFARPCAT